jgi:hypothetical protein
MKNESSAAITVISALLQRFPSIIVSAAKELVAPRPFTEFTLSEAEGFRAAAGGRLRGAMRPLAVLQSSALWLSRTLIGNLL